MSAVEAVLIWIIRHFGLLVGIVMFGAGLAFIPLLGMVSAGQLWAFIAEPLATNLWKVTLIGTAGGRLHQEASDEYVMEAATGEEEPENYWSRIVGQPFGVSYERSVEAFRERVDRIDTEAIADGGTDLPGKREERDITRGGLSTFLDASQKTGLFVRVGEKLSELKDSDGLSHVNVAEDETLKEEAGDTGMETKWRVIFWLGMAFFGTVGGVGVFFVL